jgi:transcriptional regulator NrdR family protein
MTPWHALINLRKQKFTNHSALGVHWDDHDPGHQEPVLINWYCYNPRGATTLDHMTSIFGSTGVREKFDDNKIQDAQHISAKCRAYMKNVVNSALVQVANACDLVVPQLTHSTKCFTKRDVIKALKDWEVQERAAFVYFACHYIKDHLHEEIIGINHQEAC